MSQRRDPCPHCRTLRVHRHWCPLSRERRWLTEIARKLLDRLNEPDFVPEAYRYEYEAAQRWRLLYALQTLTEPLDNDISKQILDACSPKRNPPRAMCSGLRNKPAKYGEQCTNRRQIGYCEPLCAWCSHFDSLDPITSRRRSAASVHEEAAGS